MPRSFITVRDNECVPLTLDTADNSSFRLQNVPAGKSRIRVERPGFETVDQDLDVLTTSEITIKLSASAVVESVKVSASAVLIPSEPQPRPATLTRQQIEQLPTASRNYTHLIVGEAVVAAPVADRTGGGRNLATAPGSQADDGTQSLNPSVNGARPTNNSPIINSTDATNMMNGGGSLGNNLTVPLDVLEAVETQTALYSATTGRNGGANIQMITRVGTNEFDGRCLTSFRMRSSTLTTSF